MGLARPRRQHAGPRLRQHRASRAGALAAYSCSSALHRDGSCKPWLACRCSRWRRSHHDTRTSECVERVLSHRHFLLLLPCRLRFCAVCFLPAEPRARRLCRSRTRLARQFPLIDEPNSQGTVCCANCAAKEMACRYRSDSGRVISLVRQKDLFCNQRDGMQV